MILEAAIGDAYGAPYEYAPAKFVDTNNDGETMRQHPKWPGRGVGRYTDDTQMAIAIAEMMLEGVSWTRSNIANRFVRDFKRDQRTGYARGFYALLNSISNGDELLIKIIPVSDKSGGAMRSFPLGLYRSIERVKNVAEIQAAVTHDTPDGKAAAVASALCVHYFAYNLGYRQELPAFIEKHVEPITGPSWSTPYTQPVGEKGWMSVQAAITALSDNNNKTLRDVLCASIGFTGDVDTVATISMGAGSLASDLVNNLPLSLVDGLENVTYGHDYLKWLDRQLMLKFFRRFHD